MLSILSILISIVISLPFVLWFFYLYKFRGLKKVPGPAPLPIIGNAIEIGDGPIGLFENMRKFAHQYGGVYKMFIGPSIRVVFSRPELMEHVFTSTANITKSGGYDFFRPWLADGLLTSTGEKWKIRRKIITPTFHFKILEGFVEIFDELSNVLVGKLMKRVGEESVDIKPYIHLFALDIICETSMGTKMDTQNDQNKEYVKSVRDFLNIFIIRFFSSWKKFPLLFRFSEHWPTHEKALKVLHDFSNNVIRTRKIESNFDLKDINDDGIKKRLALVDTLLLQQKISNFTDEDIREEIDTLSFEGHDTVSAGLSFLIYCLANNLQVQKKAYEEIQSIFQTGEKITIPKLQELKYLDMVVKESQRLFPSVPFIERYITEPITIDGITYPKGTTINLFIYEMHHSSDVYPSPEKFDPERFLPENVNKRHNFAYVPFSAGPRNCIGQKFAMFEMKCTVIKLLKSFEILPVAGFKPLLGMSAILQSYNGICVKFRKR